MALLNNGDLEGKFNNVSTGLFKTNTSGDIGSDDARALVEDLTDSFVNKVDDVYTSYVVTASGTDTYTATSSPSIGAYTSGTKFFVKFTNANTGAATLNLNAIGAISIKKSGTDALSAGDIAAGQVLQLFYDGTNFQVVGGGGGGGVGAAQDIEEVLTEGDDAGGLQIKNIGTPTDPADAATKDYVDAQIVAADTQAELAFVLSMYNYTQR
jgi:hypothetical protein